MDLEGGKGNIKREEARQEEDRFSRDPNKNKQDKEVDKTEGLRLKKLYYPCSFKYSHLKLLMSFMKL